MAIQPLNLYRRFSLLGTTLATFFCGQKVGSDSLGNVYYESRNAMKTPFGPKKRRWVVYNSRPEASIVPPEWHGWLHYTMDAPLTEGQYAQPWQQPHQENLTATEAAYHPPGTYGQRAKATGDYEAWKPN
jgi:NADH:ubiquinone oxidoreductase subunit